MKRRFSSYMLMGKVATLPALSSKVMAANPPDYTDLTNANVSIVVLPSTGQVSLTQTQYGNVPSLCVGTNVPATMSVVVTGINPGDTVYLAASTDSNNAAFLKDSASLQIGSQNLTVIDEINNGVTTLGAAAEAGAVTSAVKFNVDLNALGNKGFSFSNGTSFFLQALAVPGTGVTSSNIWSVIRYSSLVTVTADNGHGQYSSCYGY